MKFLHQAFLNQAVIGCALAGFAMAQTPVADGLVSPEVKADRTATFRIRAPKATEVSLYGDWMPVGKPQNMTKGRSRGTVCMCVCVNNSAAMNVSTLLSSLFL